MDKDSCKSQKKISEALEIFSSSKKVILLGTDMALPYLKDVSLSAIVSLDAMLAVPVFSAEERAFRTILNIRENTKKTLIIQTRTPDNKMLKYAAEGSTAQFIKEELKLRNDFLYPPFATFIKISVTGPRELVISETKKLMQIFVDYKPRAFRGLIPYGNKFILTTLIRTKNSWPNHELISLLRALPLSYKIEIT